MNHSQMRTIQAYLLAARPKTLPAAAAPVIAGTAVAWQEGASQPGPAVAALLAALLLQVGANYANDAFDFQRGADTGERLGPLRVTQAGLLSYRQVLAGMWVVFGLSALLGIYLIWAAGWPVLLIGLAAIAAAIAYTGGPLPFGYYGLGEVFVFLFFGLAAVAGTYYVQAQEVSTAAWWMSVPMGLLTAAILVVNNLRDIPTDRAAGKRTLAVRLGAEGARVEFVLLLAGAYLAPLLLSLTGRLSWLALLTWLSIPFAARVTRSVYRDQGKALNRTLAWMGQLELVYALLFAAGAVLDSFLA